jgi:hypothetical protein
MLRTTLDSSLQLRRITVLRSSMFTPNMPYPVVGGPGQPPNVETLGLQLAYTTRRVAPLDALPYTEYLCALGRLTAACVLYHYNRHSSGELTLRLFRAERLLCTTP